MRLGSSICRKKGRRAGTRIWKNGNLTFPNSRVCRNRMEIAAPAPRVNPWLLAIRPKTLPAAIAPVLVGTAVASAEGEFVAWVAALAFLVALLLQIGANLANDVFDYRRGADTSER